MVIARVVGTIVATRKHFSHEGCKILMVQPLDLDGSESGDTILALEGKTNVDAGVGDRVLVVQEGWAAATAVDQAGTPIDAAVLGVIDHVELDESFDPASSA